MKKSLRYWLVFMATLSSMPYHAFAHPSKEEALQVSPEYNIDPSTNNVVEEEEEPIIVPGNYFMLTWTGVSVDGLVNNSQCMPIAYLRNPFGFGNFALLYAIRFKHSKLALCPGVGTSIMKYSFERKSNNVNDDSQHKVLQRVRREKSEMKEIDKSALGRAPSFIEIKGAQLHIRYLDFLLRLRVNSVADDPHAGFHAWAGASVSIPWYAKTYVQYTKYNESGAQVVTEGFSLRKFVLGVQGGVGYTRFTLSGTYNFSPMFEDQEGPEPAQGNAIRSWNIGFQLNLL